ncbi:MAG: EAL domain-containing protein [Candidatus Saccharibacteria bacterium]|nr:EAL domain-containing protein [Rhodoferax sp.]
MSSALPNALEEVQRLQTELHAAQRRLQAVADASGSLMGNFELALHEDGLLVLVSVDGTAETLLGMACTPFLGQDFLGVFPGLQGTQVPAGLRDVALTGCTLGPLSLQGKDFLSGKAFNCLAFQLAAGRVVVKFWDCTGAQEVQTRVMRSQEQLSVMFSKSPAAISLTRVRDGAYVDVNEEWSLLTGMSLQAAMGRTSIELGVWTDAAHRDAALKLMGQTGRLRDLDVPYIHPDGKKMMLLLNASRIEIGESAYLLTYWQDVTAQREVQTALLASRQLLKSTNQRLNQQIGLFESMEQLAGVGYWTSGDDSRSVRWSNGMYRLCSVEPGTVLDRAAGRSAIHPDDQQKFEDARTRVDGKMLEFRWLHPDGRMRWIRSCMLRLSGEGPDAMVFGMVQDVTVEREATQALQERLEFVQKITSSVPGVVFQFRLTPDGSHVFPFVSSSTRELYREFTHEDLMRDATCTWHLHHPDDAKAFMASIRASARDLTPWRHEYRLLFDDGEVRWLQGEARPEREATGAVLWNGFTTNITPRKLAEEKLKESEARFKALTALSSDWYWEQDAHFRFVRFEGRLVGVDGRVGDGIVGLTRWELGALNMTEKDWAAHRTELQAHISFHDLELQELDAQGARVWRAISGEPIFDAQGVFSGYRGIGRDVTSRKQAEEKIERLAFYDVLTGLPNRRLLMDRLQHALHNSGRDGLMGALLFIDLDNFKDLNDTQGHDMGDRLLKQVAIRLGECVREVDTVARLGGDEFVIILSKLSSDPAEAAAQAEIVGGKILATLNQSYSLGTRDHHSTPSIGITLFDDHRLSIDELLKRADLAMYQSKAAGRNTLRFYDPHMQAVVAARAAMEFDLRQGLQCKQLLLYYQPVVNESGGVVGFEALARWQHPLRGMVMPGEFIPLAEQAGLIVPLGQWVLEAACAQLAAWALKPHTAQLTLAVNVSVRQFRQSAFVAEVLRVLERSGAYPRLLRLEITESLLVDDMRDATQKMSQLRAVGLRFSLDDFGTGYSSLAYLRQLSLEQLKIDQSFVHGVFTNASDAAIVQTVLTLGQTLGLTVVAEGVETQAQWDFLKHHGCRMFQGYLFGRPLPLSQLRLDEPVEPVQPA